LALNERIATVGPVEDPDAAQRFPPDFRGHDFHFLEIIFCLLI
jgi:hypothetical protein